MSNEKRKAYDREYHRREDVRARHRVYDAKYNANLSEEQKERRKQKQHEWYERNKERILAKQKANYVPSERKHKTSEEKLEYRREYNKRKRPLMTEEQRERERERHRIWRNNHLEKAREWGRKYYSEHREENIEKCRRWRLNHKERCNEYVAVSRAKKKGIDIELTPLQKPKPVELTEAQKKEILAQMREEAHLKKMSDKHQKQIELDKANWDTMSFGDRKAAKRRLKNAGIKEEEHKFSTRVETEETVTVRIDARTTLHPRKSKVDTPEKMKAFIENYLAKITKRQRV